MTATADAIDWRDLRRSLVQAARNRRMAELEVTKTNNTVPGPMLALSRGKGGTLRPASPVEIAEAEEMELVGRRRRSEPARRYTEEVA